MKRLLIILMLALLLAACGSKYDKEKEREIIDSINENIEGSFATSILTDVWHIENHVYDGEELDEDRLFEFTDENVMDREKFNSLNGYEQGLVMITSTLITRSIAGEYKDTDIFEEDLAEFYDVLEHGDDLFID